MALLDVSEILSDPDFADILHCERNTQTVGPDGRATNTPAFFTFWGVVTNDSGDVLERRPDGERVVGNITVHTRFRLIDGEEPNKTADIVEFRGRRFTVAKVGDNSHFGSGFTVASCEPIKLSG